MNNIVRLAHIHCGGGVKALAVNVFQNWFNTLSGVVLFGKKKLHTRVSQNILGLSQQTEFIFERKAVVYVLRGCFCVFSLKLFLLYYYCIIEY